MYASLIGSFFSKRLALKKKHTIEISFEHDRILFYARVKLHVSKKKKNTSTQHRIEPPVMKQPPKEGLAID